MTLSPVATCVAQLVTPVYAAEATQTYATPNGVADFGKGNASITITPNAGQSLVGKKFQVYKLFDAENAVDNESINYTWNNDYKTALQEITQAQFASIPEYKIEGSYGPDHKKEFEVSIWIDGVNYGSANGKSKKLAQQAVAKIAIEKLKEV